jgi:hypothetical protein
MKRIYTTGKKQVHEYVSVLMQLAAFVFLLLVSGWYNDRPAKQKQHKRKSVSDYAVKSLHNDILRAAETSETALFQRQAGSHSLLKKE